MNAHIDIFFEFTRENDTETTSDGRVGVAQAQFSNFLFKHPAEKGFHGIEQLI